MHQYLMFSEEGTSRKHISPHKIVSCHIIGYSWLMCETWQDFVLKSLHQLDVSNKPLMQAILNFCCHCNIAVLYWCELLILLKGRYWTTYSTYCRLGLNNVLREFSSTIVTLLFVTDLGNLFKINTSKNQQGALWEWCLMSVI